MVTPATFRQQFSEFDDPTTYSDFAIGAWINLAGLLLDPNRWGTLLDYGTSLFVAHRIALAKRDALTAARGGIPGVPVGVLTAKAIDKVSASYDIQSITIKDGGQWNMTRYGIELFQLMNQMGAGALQIGNNGSTYINWPGFAMGYY